MIPTPPHHSHSAVPNARPHLFVITLGRARPGFDQEWSARMIARCHAHLAAHYHATLESETVKSPTRLQQLLVSVEAGRADALVFLQPSIADGILINPIAQYAAQKPLLFWATPERPDGNIVSSNSLVGVHLFISTLAQYGGVSGFVYGDPEEAGVQRELAREVGVLAAVSATRRARIGLIGAHAPGFIDLHVDPRHLSAQTGATLEQLTMHQFFEAMSAVSRAELEEYSDRLRERALPMRDIAPAEQAAMLQMQARYWAAYCGVMRAQSWDTLALRCWPDLPQKYGCWPYLAVSMMLSDGEAVAIEGDVDAALSTMAARYLAPGAVYLSDWLAHDERAVVLWHGGAIDPALCVSDSSSPHRVHIAPHFNSKTPAVIEGDLQAGLRVTLWRVWQSRGCYYSTALEGETTPPIQHFRGTTARIECARDNPHEWLRQRLRHAMPHHVLMLIGHRTHELAAYAHHMGWEWVGWGGSEEEARGQSGEH